MKPTRMLSVRNFALALCVAVAEANGGVQNVTGSCEANRTMVHPKGQRAAILAEKTQGCCFNVETLLRRLY